VLLGSVFFAPAPATFLSTKKLLQTRHTLKTVEQLEQLEQTFIIKDLQRFFLFHAKNPWNKNPINCYKKFSMASVVIKNFLSSHFSGFSFVFFNK
jgi:hypothetical protein